MTQAQQQIVAQGTGKNIRRRADIADAAADHRNRDGGDVDAADRDPAAGRRDQAGQQQRKLVLAAAALADDRDMLVERDAEVDAVDDPAAAILGERQIGNDYFAGEPRHRFGLVELQPRVHHAGGLELLDDLLVCDLGSLEDLIEAEQFIPRRCQILVGDQHRQQRADRKAAADHQVAADRKKKEGRQLSQESC